ncbi:MAG TPA: hypothetical protein P5556_01095 [Candidatus Gastranaerophilales bacterium]|nr:hypothetical protein [Candidatus Gastranaerophilales bacterium]
MTDFINHFNKMIFILFLLAYELSKLNINSYKRGKCMGTVKSLLERSRDFEEAHCTCRELMEDQLHKIESYTTKWMLVGFSILLLGQAGSFIFFYNKFDLLEKKVDYRYFLTKDSLEDIHKVKIEEGRVIWKESKPESSR